MAPPPPPPPKWAVLRRSLRTSSDIPNGASISVALHAPPRTSQLLVPPSAVFSGSVVLAADPSGILLLSGTDPLAGDEPTGAPSYYLYDAVSMDYINIPAPETHLPAVHGSTAAGVAGLLVVPVRFGRDDIAIVAELSVCGSTSALRCFSTETSKWTHKDLSTPPPIIKLQGQGQWRSAYAVSYRGRLWWVDISRGLLACDPFADNPVLHFVPLPAGCRRRRMLKRSRSTSGEEDHHISDDDRCVSLSCGKLRLVVINMHTIKLWTLADYEAGKWILDFDLPIHNIWAHSSYANIGLPKERPALRFVHPSNAHVVYFLVQHNLFAVDLHTKVTESASDVDDDADLLLAWELPQSLRISSSGPLSPTQESAGATFYFDRIADSFGAAYGHALDDMEFHLLSKMALAYLNRRKKKEDNMYKLSERLFLQTFVKEDRTTIKSYAHLNFYAATTGSKRVLVFAEFSSDAVVENERHEWTLSSCKILTRNYHGGLYGKNVEMRHMRGVMKRKRSIYCFACAAELLHPTSGFEGGNMTTGP